MADQELSGQLAIVTGASRGIGRSIAESLAAAGANVLLCYVDPKSKVIIQEVMENVRRMSNGARISAICADLASKDGPGSIIRKAVLFASEINNEEGRRNGCIDIIINNAAVAYQASLETLSPEMLDTAWAINAKAPILLVKAALPHLRQGRIINVSSVGARQGYPGLLAYCPTKAALEAATRCLACELKDKHSVFAVEVGPVRTGMTEGFSEQSFQDLALRTPVGGRIGIAADFVPLIKFLAGHESSWLSGQTFGASGGLHFI